MRHNQSSKPKIINKDIVKDINKYFQKYKNFNN